MAWSADVCLAGLCSPSSFGKWLATFFSSLHRAYFVLVPSLANGYFLLSQIASSELVLPESDLLSEYQNNVDELSMMANVEDDPGNGEMTAQLEMRSALQKIPIQIPTYNVLEFSCGIVRTLENTIQKKSKKTSNSSR